MSGNFNIRIDLNKIPFSGVVNIKGKDGKPHKSLVIDIEQAHLFHSPKGAVYLDLNAWENRNGISQYGDTHAVKQSLNKEERERIAALPQEQRDKLTPILGNMRPSTEAQPSPAPAVTATAEVMVGGEEELPF